MNTAHIIKTWTENTGGGCMVDFVQLEDGRVISINDESLAVWPSVEAFWDAVEDTSIECEMHHWFKQTA